MIFKISLILQGGVFDYDDSVKRIFEINEILSSPDNWNNITLINKSQTELKSLKDNINNFDELNNLFNDYKDFAEIYESLNLDDRNDLVTNLQQLNRNLEKLKIQSLLNGEADDCNCFVEIHAGAGGTESQDWAEMLMRMYERFAEKNKYKCSVIDYQKGEEAGIKNTTLLISDLNLMDILKESVFID